MGLEEPEALRDGAIAVLRRNDAGAWTKPSASQYPHQWNWDSAFIAMGWATFDWDRACLEIESMLEARWRDGMIPHVRYDSRHLADYFPGPDWWPGAQAHVAAPAIRTSGITNPPVLVLAARRVGLRQTDPVRRHAFWRRVLPGLTRYLEWFLESRRLPASDLFVMVHPWESGWDNSPRWDALTSFGLKPSRPYTRLDTQHVPGSQRPGARDYDAYLSLVEMLERADYEIGEYVSASPFAFHDVTLDAIWYRAAVDLRAMAAEMGEPAPLGGAERFAAAFETHWDAQTNSYHDLDAHTGRVVREPSAAGLVALVAGLSGRQRAHEMWTRERLAASGDLMVPTVPPGGPKFEPTRYWRGPVWLNVNWLVAEGLEAAGLEDEAAALRAESVAAVGVAGFHEYFDPTTGDGLGSDSFSWTAALVLDLLNPL